MDRQQLIKISKFLSLMLRHEPEKFGLVLDAEGYTPIEDVLRELRKTNPSITVADINDVVEKIEPDKRRFTIEGDDIRANYGHSLEKRIAHEVVTPPVQLLHGTTAIAVDRILSEGLKPMKRQYVHLTTDVELARRVGARRGKATILLVNAAAAHSAGVLFYQANDSFWLVDAMPAKYLSPSKL